jgi:nucleotide-binding universal stress UspA family protein
MYRVLLPIDADESRATAQAATAANLPNAAEEVVVHLLHVYDDPEWAEASRPTETKAGEEAQAFLEAAGVTVREMSRHGTPAEGILNAAEEVNADLILMGGRKRSPLGSALFGSVSQQVTLDADRPVVVTGDREEEGMPSHRCANCGEEFYTQPDLDIPTCRACGGTHVEQADLQEQVGTA